VNPRSTLVAAFAVCSLVASRDLRAQGAPPMPPPSPAARTGELAAPTLLSDASVAYPSGATGDATVVLTITVNADGSVRSAAAAEANEPFSSVAVRAALGFRFEPAMRDGKPLAARIRIQLTFRAPEPPAKPPNNPAVIPSATNTPGSTNTPPASSSATAPKPPPRARPSDAPDEVLVRGAHAEPSRSATLSRAEVRQIPGAFGDPFRAIEIMPGVTPIVSGLPFFFIRGAPPGNVGYFLDGVRVPYLFHVGAGPSVIHPGLVDRVDLYPGGYPARFGRYSGGIVSGESTPPSFVEHGEYNVRLFDAGGLLETPFADGRGTVLLGGRYSYTSALLTLLSSNTTLDYWDYQARVTYDVTPSDRIGVFAFGASDFLGQRTPTGTDTVFGAEFYRVDARYDHVIDENGVMRTAVTGGIDRTRLDQGRFLRDRLIGTRTEITYRLSPRALLRAGTDAQVDSYDIELSSADQNAAAAKILGAFPSRDDIAFTTRGDVVFDVGRALQVTPGVRFDFFGSQGNTAFAIDPRLAARTEVTDHLRLLSAFGVAHQPPSFVIPVPGFQPGGLRGGLQSAVQESMGFELDLDPTTTATATVFKNAFFNLSDALSVTPPVVSGCAPGTFPGDTLAGDPGTQPGAGGGGGRACGTARFPQGTVGPDRSGGGGQAAQSAGDTRNATAFETRARGTAYGLELFLKRKLTSRIGGFVSYTLSRSTRSANNQDFIASFDRTHVLNAAIAVDLGRNWRAGTRGTFYTGLPKAHDPTDPSATRLAPFFRLDLRLEKRWQLKGKKWIAFVAEWMNATLSKESIGTSCTLSGCQETKIGPVTIPSIGVEGGF
jgi:TonB family protein